ncbi:Uncharacterized iron-regulated membrane protein [Vibrio xiamenensis]|uniref:Uncharacterized iron-regulated membrane protein n=1 Tax=Vibrio xiamenensis TaxID=861298 RepID=A0A1G8AAC9_9VIBR|nr:PepSY domain-containing protein [Vibrio xiamenensis]SDH17849.1 Uncharacterized iron-regulated membrane protein [Vibrio xiamenensis]
MLSESTQLKMNSTRVEKARYFSVWRWHFYAGLYVIPFMLMLCVTGIIMLFDSDIEQLRYGQMLTVEAAGDPLPVSEQLDAVREAFPDYSVTQFIPSGDAHLANRFSISSPSGESVFALVNPYSGAVQGTIDRSHSVYQWANKIHSTLLLGDSGDYLIEVAASLGILLLVSGVYLWWPRNSASRAGFLRLRFASGKRVWLRDLHANIGGVLSLALLFFLISGLSWTGFWGKQLVQAWNTFPAYYTWGDKPKSELTHTSLNHGAEKEMPWNLEQTPLPTSHDHSKMGHSDGFMPAHGVNIDQIVNQAKVLGFSHYRVYFPQSATGVYTVAANSMAGDVTDPRLDRTSHFDQYNGQLLVEVTWNDYSPFAKWMAASVSLHQGDLSLLNKIANLFICLAFMVFCVAAVVMWWLRRPQARGGLGAPPKFEHQGVWKVALLTLVVLCLAFPLGGGTIVLVLIFDWLMVRHVPRVKRALS